MNVELLLISGDLWSEGFDALVKISRSLLVSANHVWKASIEKKQQVEFAQFDR